MRANRRIFSSLTTKKPSFSGLAEFHCNHPEVQNAKSDLTPFLQGSVIQKLKHIFKLNNSNKNLEDISSNEIDSSMKELYEAEIASLKTEMLDYDNQLIESFFDFKNKDITEVLVEIRAGTGGSEAALFASELFDLYKLYFQYKKWKYHIVSESIVGAHTREVILSVDEKCYAEFSCETGIHRVQRVPETESQGRIHTSTVSVAVIPQKSKSDDILEMKDVRMDVYRSSGPGGQNVNKTNSAVRLVHVPTGITVCMQDERSQVENRLRALKVLKFRLAEKARNLKQQNTKSIRSEQIGNGDRSVKIRTYNFPQNRITDHRFSWTNQNIGPFFKDAGLLNELILSFQYYSLNQLLADYCNKIVVEE